MPDPTDPGPASAGNQQATPRRGGRFAPGKSGNPSGRKPGSRNIVAAEVAELASTLTVPLLRKAAALAMGGDSRALKLLLDRFVPIRSGAPVALTLPMLDGMEGTRVAFDAVLAGVAGGDLTPAEGEAVGRLLAARAQAVELATLQAEMADLRDRLALGGDTSAPPAAGPPAAVLADGTQPAPTLDPRAGALSALMDAARAAGWRPGLVGALRRGEPDAIAQAVVLVAGWPLAVPAPAPEAPPPPAEEPPPPAPTPPAPPPSPPRPVASGWLEWREPSATAP